MRPPRKALASTGSTAGGAFLRDEPEVDRAEQKAAQHRRAKGGEGRDALGGAQVNIEGNAENPHMRDVDDAGHHGDAQAGEDAYADRKRRHAKFARAQSRARGREHDQRRARHRDQPSATSNGRAHVQTYARRALPCQGRRTDAPSIMPQSAESAMSSRWIISARPAVPRICAISRELRPRMRSACSAS